VKMEVAPAEAGGSTATLLPKHHCKRIPRSGGFPHLRLGRPEGGPLHASMPSEGDALCCFRRESSLSGPWSLSMICEKRLSRLEMIVAVSLERAERALLLEPDLDLSTEFEDIFF